jgi:hypothetical protein
MGESAAANRGRPADSGKDRGTVSARQEGGGRFAIGNEEQHWGHSTVRENDERSKAPGREDNGRYSASGREEEGSSRGNREEPGGPTGFGPQERGQKEDWRFRPGAEKDRGVAGSNREEEGASPGAGEGDRCLRPHLEEKGQHAPGRQQLMKTTENSAW